MGRGRDGTWARYVSVLGVVASCSAPPAASRSPAGQPQPTAHPIASTAPPGPVPAAQPSPAQPSTAQPSTEDTLPARRDDMLLVPAGEFVMGADEGGEPDEHPAHRVTVKAFYLDETEVTNEAYAEGVAAGICNAPYPRSAEANGFGTDRRFRGPRQPVSSVSWNDAQAYCAWRSKRLPTEAEWERAARGDDGRRYPWGDEAPDETRARFSGSVTSEVKSHPAGVGPYGHHDLAGNVWEWVQDVYDPLAYRRPQPLPEDCDAALAAYDELRRKHLEGFTGSNPIPNECERVLRGGAFNYPPGGLRASNRVHHPPHFRLVMSGFRCARDP